MEEDLQQTAPLFRSPRCAPPLLKGSGRRTRRRKMAVARLGNNNARPPRRFAAGALRRLRLRWVMALYRRALRRLRAAYAAAVQDVVEGAAMVGAARLHGEF